ncbi:MAG: RNA polymerase sigma factor [Actinomycetota bacterium]|nr:RNA polymerase sigma factor [Actinomycetota bacterium]
MRGKSTIAQRVTEEPLEGAEPYVPSAEDARLLHALRAGDEQAFAALVHEHHSGLLRLARMYVSDRAVAEEVVQEAWLGFLESLERFEGRASIKTWLFRILVNVARKRGGREARSVPFSSVWRETDEPDIPSVDPDRFRGPGDHWEGHWKSYPASWEGLPEEHLLSHETRALVDAAISRLPPAQAEVMTLRDLQGWSAQEVCNVLGVTDTNQRVLLHRARSKVRRELERYLEVRTR